MLHPTPHPPACPGKSRSTRVVVPCLKTCIPGHKSTRFAPVLQWIGSSGCPEMDSKKKKKIRFFIFIFSGFFSIFSPHFYIKKRYSKLGSTYVHVYLIYIGGPQCGGIFFCRGDQIAKVAKREYHSHDCGATWAFFDAAGQAQAPWEARGKEFPQSLHPGFFLMLWNEPRRRGEPGGNEFPQSLHPWCRCATQNPADHPFRLSIHIRDT